VVKDETVLVVGRVIPEEDKVKLIASAVIPLDKAAEKLQQKTAGVLLKVPATLCDEEWLGELEELLKRHPGAVPVYMDVVRDGEAVTRLALCHAFKVNAGKKLLPALETFLGQDRVRFIFRTAGAPSAEKRA